MKTIAAALALLAATAALAQGAPPPSPEVPPPGPPPAYAPPPPPPPGYAPPPAYYPPPRQRDTWYIGFGLGTGGGGYTQSDGTRVTFSDAVGSDPVTVSLNFKVGATLTPNLLLGFDTTAVRTAGTFDDAFGNRVTTAIQVNNYDAMLTWFPVGSGFYLRGGAGLASIVADVSVNGGGLRGSATRNGVGIVAGAGYAFWLGRSFNLTLNLDLSGQSYGKKSSDPSAPRSSSAANLFVGFDWY
jgi:hypothetical protein